MSKLSTHVLDTMHGGPAAGLKIELRHFDGSSSKTIRTAFTNSDGRTDGPLLDGTDFAAGTYEIIFSVGDYFKGRGVATGTLPFLGDVPVRFGISEGAGSYHVPLLVSPWAYSTYRGS